MARRGVDRYSEGVPNSMSDLETTTMAIREHLMTYFKGTCVDRMIRQSNISTRSVSDYRLARPQFIFQRRENEIRGESFLFIDDTILMRLSHEPEMILMYDKVFARSTEFAKVKLNIENFMAKFLPPVKVAHSDVTRFSEGGNPIILKTKKRDDSNRLAANKLEVPKGEDSDGDIMEKMAKHYSVGVETIQQIAIGEPRQYAELLASFEMAEEERAAREAAEYSNPVLDLAGLNIINNVTAFEVNTAYNRYTNFWN